MANELGEIDYRKNGILAVARDEGELAALRHAFQGERRYLSGEEAMGLEPNLAEIYGGALTEEATLDPRLTLKALGDQVSAAGGRTERDRICIIERKNGRITEVIGQRGSYRADEFIFAPGAWSSSLFAELPVRPLKGQMLCFRPPAEEISHPPPLTRSIWVDGYYLVTRADRLLFGATVEERGFDRANTADKVSEMLNLALEIAPFLRHWRFECWSGLRPVAIDGMPIIGRVAKNGAVATGHHRNGILLAPATAELVSAILDERAGFERELAAFAPSRFAVGAGGRSLREEAEKGAGKRRALSVA